VNFSPVTPEILWLICMGGDCREANIRTVCVLCIPSSKFLKWVTRVFSLLTVFDTLVIILPVILMKFDTFLARTDK